MHEDLIQIKLLIFLDQPSKFAFVFQNKIVPYTYRFNLIFSCHNIVHIASFHVNKH